MRFTISREALLRPLQVVGGVVEKRQTLPVLSNILVNAEPDRVTLTGTDLEVELTAAVPVIGADTGDITLPARKFMDICKALPEGAEIDITVDGEKARFRSGKSRFTLATLPAAEFPATEAIAGAFEFEIPQGELRHLIEKTQFCMANQDVRYYLNGLLLEFNAGSLRTVATDGHRLALSDRIAEQTGTEQRQVIIPRKGVMELFRLLVDSKELCRVQLNTNHIKVELPNIGFTSKLVDGRFPDYERVVPKGGDKIVTADRESLRQALVRAAILSNEKYRGIRLELSNDQLRAVVNNPEQEEAEEELDVDYQGEELEIGFNVAYLLEAINAIDEEQVEITLSDANSSCLVRGLGNEGSRYVVMPMRL
ncbi:DNA polymerase III subunit beta [Thiohalomonas denitrificans]|uniref:DNA polymerase III subunit beta n=1 Tax=Thiohalomonas denitrificans TaxID=415747 RepID=UPI0026F1E00A|nr:DNA polymerase III subunit beta [Thiohalomonas denitrificans]